MNFAAAALLEAALLEELEAGALVAGTAVGAALDDALLAELATLLLLLDAGAFVAGTAVGGTAVGTGVGAGAGVHATTNTVNARAMQVSRIIHFILSFIALVSSTLRVFLMTF